MGNLHESMHVFVFTFELYMKAQKHEHFHVFSPFSTFFYPPLHHNGKRSSAFIPDIC